MSLANKTHEKHFTNNVCAFIKCMAIRQRCSPLSCVQLPGENPFQLWLSAGSAKSSVTEDTTHCYLRC
jgi:hypothetical protein